MAEKSEQDTTTEKLEVAPLTCMTNVTTKPIKVRLNEIVLEADRYCHRNPGALSEASLQSLMDSLIVEKGMQIPIEVFRDKLGRIVLIKGHRRVSAQRLLADRNTPGFTHDMELDAQEALNFTSQDLLVRSVFDNEQHQKLTRVERILAAKRLYDGGVEVTRAAIALDISLKSYERDLLIARHPWMFQHIQDSSIDATAAYELLDAATKAQRLAEVKEDLDAWIAEQKRVIRQEARSRERQGAKPLSPAEQQVKRRMARHLINHWLDLIQQGQRFDEEAEWDFGAHLDRKNRVLRIPAVTLDLDKDPPEKIAKVGSKLSLLSKGLAPEVKKRMTEEPAAQADDKVGYDLDYLNEVGAHDLAEHLEIRADEDAEGEEGEDAEEQPDVHVPRAEAILKAEGKLPEEETMPMGAEVPAT